MYKPDPKKMLKPESDITQYQIFATMQRVRAIQAGLPDLYAYGNAIWVAEKYYRGDLTGMGLSSGTLLKLIQGQLYDRLYKPQKQGKMWLRRIGGVLCGPDLFWERVIIPLGPDFYFGTMLPEMQLLLKKIVPFGIVMNYDFHTCKKMKKIRRKEKRHGDRIAGVERGTKRERINARRIKFVGGRYTR